MVKWTSGKFYRRLFWFSLLVIVQSIIFGGIYYGLYEAGIDDFGHTPDPRYISTNEDGSSTDFNKFDFWYFSWITQTTVGYGDNSPRSTWGKIIVCAQIFIFWVTALSFAVLADEASMMCILNPWIKC